ncbi:MFS transporter [Microbulbifer epialgicus]|uniref:MFS transporter n=1 Tax=Microbulbifer epialgicus TaxID=393907 RepID=A0ABV4P579_9GAMM
MILAVPKSTVDLLAQFQIIEVKKQPMTTCNRPLSGQHYWGLFVLFLAVFLVAGDFTAFPPALPRIAENFSIDITAVHWVVNAYSLAYGVLIVTSGRLADIYGRKNIFFTGIAIFALSSLAGGLALETWVLLTSRALMGLGGALIWSAILGMAYNLLPGQRAGLAGGFTLAALGFAAACGPVIGGFFSEYLSWRWILFMNIPLALLTACLCWQKYPAEMSVGEHNKVDYVGVITLSVSLFFFLLGMDIFAQYGLEHPLFLLLLVFALLTAFLFVAAERWAKNNALIPVDLVRNQSFMAAGLSVLLVAVAFFETLVYIPLLLIKVYKFTALQAGVALLPMMIASGTFAFFSGLLYERVGKKVLICIGALGMSLGLFCLASLSGKVNYIYLVPGLLLIGICLGVYSPAIVTAAMTVVDSSESSLAGAIIYMFRFLGGAFGLGFNAIILSLAPDIATGIRSAFMVDGFITLAGFFVSLFYFKGSTTRIFKR